MKRKQFIKRAAILGTGALLSTRIPLWAQTVDDPCFKDFFGNDTSNQKDIPQFRVKINLCVDTILAFSKAESKHKILRLAIFLLDNNNESISKYHTANYTIQAARKEGSAATYKVIAKRTEVTLKAAQLPSEYDWTKLQFTFNYNDLNSDSSIHLIKKNNKTLQLVPPADDDCFITTACVSAMGKTDNCAELVQLRSFRNTILVGTEQGKKLVDQYYQIAPQIVQNINKQTESLAIYTAIYEGMIVPTLECIAQEKYDEAVHIYENFTLDLQRNFCRA